MALNPSGSYFIVHQQLRHPEWILAKSRARTLIIQVKAMGIRLLLLSDQFGEALALDEIHFTRKLNSQQAIDQLQAFIPLSLMAEADPMKVVMVYDSEVFTLCPQPLFEPENKSALLETLGYLPPESEVWSQPQPETDFVIVHAIPREWIQWTSQVFTSSESIWISSLSGLIFNFRRLSESQNLPIMLAHIESGHLYVMGAEGGKILLVNRFVYQAENDLLYFILLIARELNFAPAEIRLVLSGQLLSGSLGFEKLSRYFGKMEFSRSQPFFSVPSGLDILHHPQYLDFISIADYLSAS